MLSTSTSKISMEPSLSSNAAALSSAGKAALIGSNATDTLLALPPSPYAPLCIGHRGYPAKWPENTMLSIIEALRAGADGIETDLRISADRQIILNHDLTLDRTINGKGVIHDLPWYNHMELLRTLEGHQPIARLRDLLYLLRFAPRFSAVQMLILDIKDDNPIEILDHLKALFEEMDTLSDGQAVLDVPAFVSAILGADDPSLLGKAPLGAAWKSRIVLGVWDLDYMHRAKALFPSYKISLIAAMWPPLHVPGYPILEPWSVEFDNLSIDYNHLSPKLVSEARKRNRTICSWTINEERDAKLAAQCQADAILTDNVPVCLNTIRTLVDR